MYQIFSKNQGIEYMHELLIPPEPPLKLLSKTKITKKETRGTKNLDIGKQSEE